YTNKSSFSQIINGKVSLPDGFIKKLVSLDHRISESWLLNEEGGITLDKQVYNFTSRKNLIPLYNEVASIGGTDIVAESSAAYSTVEYIDAGDLFPSATAAIRHYGSSMIEYPSGCILFLKKVEDRRLIVWGSTN